MARRRDPFKEIEELFERMSTGFEGVGEQIETEVRGIHVDIADEDDELVVTADVPGFEKEDIDVTVEDRRLRIAAERAEETEEETEREEKEERSFIRRERHRESVSRTIKLPVEVAEEEASASYENGVLTVHLPKAGETETGHDIEIR